MCCDHTAPHSVSNKSTNMQKRQFRGGPKNSQNLRKAPVMDSILVFQLYKYFGTSWNILKHLFCQILVNIAEVSLLKKSIFRCFPIVDFYVMS